jgi:hypothetical protein
MPTARKMAAALKAMKKKKGKGDGNAKRKPLPKVVPYKNSFEEDEERWPA